MITNAVEQVRLAHEGFLASDARRQAAVLEARRVGASWTAIADVIGTTKQGARQRYVGAEEIGKMAAMLDDRLKVYAQGQGHLLTYAEALELAISRGVLSEHQGKSVRAVYEAHAEASRGNLVPSKNADLLATDCISISAKLFSAAPSV
ncbi:hypothetical protein EFL95_18085 [Nocardioides marmorisolisilvae]|uniref:Uncharacterized protein n=2 Tax=Nocardioides marmorisolisilvae TaxID=1542737 RepID=A0A3N0DI57_9ACTN|nr:hypothetical protein EFL95_18085 [Nocardioides marmorisolisilvae]